ncbi:MAG: Na+/H+ antiporter subunit E [Rudaea sp.]
MNGFSRLLPHPLASLGLWAVWLIANYSLAFGHVVLGALLGLALPALTRPLWPERLRFHHPGKFVRLLAVVLYDIVVANVHVAGLILRRRSRLRPAFVAIPLRVTNPYAISALASIITLTPGTVSADLSADHRTLLVHVLDLSDEAAMVAQIRSRYEAPLMEILEC